MGFIGAKRLSEETAVKHSKMDGTPGSLQAQVLQFEAIFLCNQTTTATYPSCYENHTLQRGMVVK